MRQTEQGAQGPPQGEEDGVGTIGKAGAEVRLPPRASLPRLPGSREFPGLCRVPSHGPIGRAPSGGDVPSRTLSAVWKVGTVTPTTPTCCEDSVRMYLKRPVQGLQQPSCEGPGRESGPCGLGLEEGGSAGGGWARPLSGHRGKPLPSVAPLAPGPASQFLPSKRASSHPRPRGLLGWGLCPVAVRPLDTGGFPHLGQGPTLPQEGGDLCGNTECPVQPVQGSHEFGGR